MSPSTASTLTTALWMQLQSLSTLPEEGFDDVNSTATVRVHPSGKAVYVSNRGHDSIAAFITDPSTGLLTPAGHSPTKECPRAFGLDPDGDFLYAGSDHSAVSPRIKSTSTACSTPSIPTTSACGPHGFSP